jgi:hypothetical protein
MLIQELYDHFGSWARLCRDLEFGSTTYQNWLKNGCIPYTTQLLIEKKTNNKFLADENHCKKD